jgi:hypothetical protein
MRGAVRALVIALSVVLSDVDERSRAGRFATLKDVVEHYNDLFKLGLSDREKTDLIEYLKSR